MSDYSDLSGALGILAMLFVAGAFVVPRLLGIDAGMSFEMAVVLLLLNHATVVSAAR